MENFRQTLDQFFNSLNLNTILGQFGLRMLETIAIILFLWGLRKVILRFVDNQTDTPSVLFAWRRFSSYTAIGIALILIYSIWADGNTGRDFAAYLGLLSAGLAIALQDPISNFSGWLFILIRRPFEIGDRIEINDLAGDVVDTSFFQFAMLEVKGWVDADQSTGRMLYIPNKFVYTYGIANFTKGFSLIWYELPVLVTFESDWREAKRILKKIGQNHALDLNDQTIEKMRGAARQYGIQYANTKPTVYTKIESYGIELTLRYLCEPRQRRNSSQIIWEAILDRFAKNPNIDFAYPTQRLYYNPIEGKKQDTEPDHDAVNPFT